MEGSAQSASTALAQLLAMMSLGPAELDRVLLELDQLRRRYVESPNVPEAVNWRSYTHEELYAMVHTGAEPARVGDQSRQLDELAGTAFEICTGVNQSSAALPSIWRGPAAQQALTTLEHHSRGGDEVGRFTASVARALDLASEALRRAQLTMPPPVSADDAATVGAVGGTAAFGPLGGYIGSEIGKCAGNQAAADAKEHAVAVMQAYERELHEAYRQVTPPAELPPGGNPGEENHVKLITPDPPVVVPPPVIGPGNGDSGGGFGSGTTGSGTGGLTPTLSVGSGVHAGHAGVPAPGSGIGQFGTAAGTSAASAVGGGGAAAGMGMGMSDGLAGGSQSGWRELTGRGAIPGMLAGGRPGAAGAGPRAGRPGSAGLGRRGGFPGLGAPGGGTASDEEDAEHRNKMPHSDQLFTFKDQPVLAPPVIGDWSQED